MMDGSSLRWPTLTHPTAKHTAAAAAEDTAAAAEELGKEVLGIHTTTCATTFQTLLSVLVIDLSLLGVRKYLVGVREVLEFIGGIRVVCILIYVEMSVSGGYGVVNFALYLDGVLRLQPYMPSSVPPLCMLERPKAMLAVVR